MNVQHINKNIFGFEVTINAGIIGQFSFTGCMEEEEEDCGGYCPVISRVGMSTPVYRNGEYFLPWHITAALTSNGNWDSAWINGKDDAVIVAELLKIRELYVNSGVWHNAVTYANQLCNEYVY